MLTDNYYVRLADAVVGRINGGDYDLWAFTAKRRHVPVYDLQALAEVVVTVIPAARENKPNARGVGNNDRTYTIDVAVQQKLAGQTDDERMVECDNLSALVAAIEDRLERIGFQWDDVPNVPPAKWLGSEVDPLWSEAHLDEFGQFTAVIRITYRG